MAAKLMLPLRQEENEVQQAAASAPWSMWRTRSAVGVEDEDDSWEVRAFADDTAGLMGGATWPPRSYSCTFCRREFRSAQALGGHMNVHRRDRARLRQSPPSGAPQDHHHHQHQPAGAFPLPEIMPTQEFPLCFLYPMPAPNSGTDQKPLLYALNPNSSMVSSSLLHSTPPLVPMSSDGGHGNSNSNLVEFFPRKSSPSSSSSPSTVLSISALSSPPGPSRLTSPAISAIKNISNGSDSAGISERTRRSDERPEKLKQIGAFHPYLPAPSRRDHQNKSSDEHSRLYGDQYLNMLNPDEGDSKENIDLELRLGQKKI